MVASTISVEMINMVSLVLRIFLSKKDRDMQENIGDIVNNDLAILSIQCPLPIPNMSIGIKNNPDYIT